MTQASIFVLRRGREVKVHVPCVVRSDIVISHGAGDVVPADMQLVEAGDVEVSEMALTSLAGSSSGSRANRRS